MAGKVSCFRSPVTAYTPLQPSTDASLPVWTENKGREKVPRLWLTAFPKTETTDKRRCRPVPQVPSVVQVTETNFFGSFKLYYVDSSFCWWFQWFWTCVLFFHNPFLSSESSLAEKPLSHSGYSQPLSINPSSTSSSSSSSTVPVSPALQASASTLLQDPALLRQLLPALQATLQMNHSNVDMGKINEGNR